MLTKINFNQAGTRDLRRDTFRQAAQIIKYQALWKSCSSLPFTRGSAAEGTRRAHCPPRDATSLVRRAATLLAPQ
jgi:hypothetical protein